MNKKVVIVLSIMLAVLLIVLGGVLYLFYPVLFPSREVLGADVPEVKITYDNMEEQLMRQSLIRDIPENGVMLLRFYSFETGERSWKKSYILRRASVHAGTLNDADIIISINERYLEFLTNKNLCSIIMNAQARGDVSVENSLSKTSLAWKYRSMLKYKDCLGL